MLAGTSPKELLAQVKKVADRVRHAITRAACRRAAIEQTSLRRQKKCAATPVDHPGLAGSLYTQGDALVSPAASRICFNGSQRKTGKQSLRCLPWKHLAV